MEEFKKLFRNWVAGFDQLEQEDYEDDWGLFIRKRNGKICDKATRKKFPGKLPIIKYPTASPKNTFCLIILTTFFFLSFLIFA